MTDTSIWVRLQHTVLSPPGPDDLNSCAGVSLRRKLVKDRVGAINAVLAEFRKRAHHPDDVERLEALKAERDSLIRHREELGARYDELDGHRQQRFHRAFNTAVRKHLGEEVFAALVAEANAAMDQAQERARNSLVGSAIPTLGVSGGMKRRASP